MHHGLFRVGRQWSQNTFKVQPLASPLPYLSEIIPLLMSYGMNFKLKSYSLENLISSILLPTRMTATRAAWAPTRGFYLTTEYCKSRDSVHHLQGEVTDNPCLESRPSLPCKKGDKQPNQHYQRQSVGPRAP